jgi:hypothetical protein
MIKKSVLKAYESSSGMTNEWKEGSKEITKWLKSIAKKIGAEVKVSVGHFQTSTYFHKNGKYVYVSTRDARDPSWWARVMYRTTTGYKDYTGGGNNWCGLEQLETNVASLLEE